MAILPWVVNVTASSGEAIVMVLSDILRCLIREGVFTNWKSGERIEGFQAGYQWIYSIVSRTRRNGTGYNKHTPNGENSVRQF